MSDTRQYIEALFAQNQVEIGKERVTLFDDFVRNELNINAVKTIQDNQKAIMDKWEIELTIRDIIEARLMIPNGMAGKPYHAAVDLTAGVFSSIQQPVEFEGLESLGLAYDSSTGVLSGVPVKEGDIKINMLFRIKEQAADTPVNIKQIPLVINADPRSLWKDIASTETADNYWKPDKVATFSPLGNRHIVAASTRGRSHANVGSFRDDDFTFKEIKETGWCVVCVADGAGSARLARQGSKLACHAIVEYFETEAAQAALKEFDAEVQTYQATQDEEASKKLSLSVYNNLSKAAHYAHKKIDALAAETANPLPDFHTTLIFTLYKKYDFGYAILSFGVGDCPIAVLDKDCTEVTLMNWLDVGEFGGGTRFITMPDIFSNDKFASRFKFKLMQDFSYLVMMTDGIYDAKFVVEANLDKAANWQAFFKDLAGDNEEKVKVDFTKENAEIAGQLSSWLNFWSQGNHDDRTLAIVF